MTTQEGERTLLRTIEGPRGTVQIYQFIPAGLGIGDMRYEVRSGGRSQTYPTIGEAMTDAEVSAGTKDA